MGDVGEDYRMWDRVKKQKKASNLQHSTDRLISLGIKFEPKNNGTHLVVKGKNHTYDFYPSTGSYSRRGGSWRRGIDSLIKDLGKDDKLNREQG
mgnify:CR=1 FL=1|tara:strand:- start:1998 stop:2279 length:282 start_codon:yes stop_codon:yes gene_type:complete